MLMNIFAVQGNSVLVAATTSTGIQATQVSTTGSGTYGCRITNASTNDVYLAIGSSTVQASIPTTAAPANGAILGGATVHVPEYFHVGPGQYVSALTSAGTAAVHVTPGNFI